MKRKTIPILLLFVILALPALSMAQPTTARFVLATPTIDEHGQGLTGVKFYENSTGSWVYLAYVTFGNWSTPIEVGTDGSIKIVTYTFINGSWLQVHDTNEGKSYHIYQTNVTLNDELVVSTDSTFVSVDTASDPMWLYEYSAILNFIPQALNTYHVSIDIQIYEMPSGGSVKKFQFQTGVLDPYANFTFSYHGGSQYKATNWYYMTTNSAGDLQFFGFNEFETQSSIYSTVLFRPTTMTGNYYYQLLNWHYQKTSLESNTHLALGLVWAATGLTFYWNTGNGNTPTTVNLGGGAPTVMYTYKIILVNTGTQTWIGVYDHTEEQWIYDGNVTTANYDASSLYCTIGQYGNGGGNVVGSWDDFTIYNDSPYWQSLTYQTSLLIYGLVGSAGWAFNGWLMLGGAGMVIFSTCFAAVKIKSREGGTDDILLFSVLFIFGWALIIGSVM